MIQSFLFNIKTGNKMSDKTKALAVHLNDEESYFNTVEEITVSTYDDCIFEYGSQEYMVCTEDEANEKWEESLDNYLEECVYPDLPENMKNYFDDEAWKRDAKCDGRGHSLSSYDGCENEININGEWFFIYRIN